MRKKGFNLLHLLWIIPVSLIVIIGTIILAVGGNCSEENQHISTGTAFSNGKCCDGLVAKAPYGFAGGAWCVQPDCDIYCLEEGTKIQGVSVSGLYSVCDDGEGPITATLLSEKKCSGYKGMCFSNLDDSCSEQRCLNSDGVWDEKQGVCTCRFSDTFWLKDFGCDSLASAHD